MKDVERLWAAGYALGSSLENSLVIGDDDRVINMGGLRYPNEFARHKTLDAMGDLALAGARFIDRPRGLVQAGIAGDDQCFHVGHVDGHCRVALDAGGDGGLAVDTDGAEFHSLSPLWW